MVDNSTNINKMDTTNSHLPLLTPPPKKKTTTCGVGIPGLVCPSFTDFDYLFGIFHIKQKNVAVLNQLMGFQHSL